MANPRMVSGEFRPLTQRQRDQLVAEFDSECEVLDVAQPTFESWLAAKLFDLRIRVGIGE